MKSSPFLLTWPLLIAALALILGGSAPARAATVPVINEFVFNHTGTDTHEFVELYGDPSTDYSTLSFLELEGDSTGAGVIDEVIAVGTTDANGFWATAFLNNAFENGTVTLLLVESFSGNAGDDLDTNNDGVLDITPWTNLVDDVAIFDGNAGDWAYSTTVLTEGYDGLSFTPGGASRIPDGADTDSTADWTRNDFDLAGIPGFTGSPEAGEAFNTPGAVNEAVSAAPADPLLNEFVASHTGTDNHEYVEVYGDPNTDYSAFTVLELEGDSTGPGVIDEVVAVGSTDASGFWVTAFLNNAFENGSISLLLVEGFTGNLGDDLDSDNDGTLDVTPWTRVVDDVAVFDGGTGDQTYATTVLTEGYDGLPFTPGGASRIPDGADTDTTADWVRNDFDLAGIPGFGGSPAPGEALNTPGATNEIVDIPPTVLEIWQIQDAAHLSDEDGQTVTTEHNIVTAVTFNGFWMQTPDDRADGDVGTSQGIFVFTNDPPSVVVGDDVSVTGSVDEFRPGGLGGGGLTITELTSPVVAIHSSGNSLPAPVVIGIGGRVPPQQVINDDGDGNVENQPPAIFDPTTDGIDFYESVEGMRVQVNEGLVVGATNRFGEIWVVSDDGANASPFTERGGLYISSDDFNPERVQLDDTLYPGDWPEINVGAELLDPAVGVVHYGFGNFEVYVTDLFNVDTSGEVSREVTGLVGDDDKLTVATYNVENLGGDAPQEELDARAGQIVNHLLSPDIIILEEMQDNNGEFNDDVVDASLTFTRLISSVIGLGGPAYEFEQINPLDDQDGGVPGGNIRVGFLYNPARVGFADGPDGDATTANSVDCTDGQPELALNPGRVDPNNPAFVDSRKPLAGEFTFNGQTVFVVGVHFSSKGGDDPLFGFTQPPVQHTQAQRIQQAQAVNDFADAILACNPQANVIVMGDVNDFQFSATLDALKGGVLNNLMDLLAPDQQYSYVFEGNSQVLDQGVVSDNLFAVAEYDVVHVNAEFADQVSDHEPSVGRFLLANFPPVCGGAAISPPTLWPPNQSFVSTTIEGVTDPEGDPITITIDSIFQDEPVVGPGSGRTAPDGMGIGTSTAELRAERDGRGNGRVYHVSFTASDPFGGSCSGEVTVGVPRSAAHPPVDGGALYDSTVE